MYNFCRPCNTGLLSLIVGPGRAHTGRLNASGLLVDAVYYKI